MLKKNIIAGILVKNFDEALDFYTTKLGFVVAEDFPMGTDRWLTITAPGNQDCVLALHEARSEADLALVGKQMGSFPFLGIATDDCLGDYEHMKARGVKFDGEPSVRPYGTRGDARGSLRQQDFPKPGTGGSSGVGSLDRGRLKAAKGWGGCDRWWLDFTRIERTFHTIHLIIT
jgi:catechol 2,3-dioxygenase-like lactoylglutathione lyase family enzyme